LLKLSLIVQVLRICTINYLREHSLSSLCTMALRFFAVLSIALNASAIELTPENWDEETSGKTIFVKFQAPW